jgi:hypothetical protein
LEQNFAFSHYNLVAKREGKDKKRNITETREIFHQTHAQLYQNSILSRRNGKKENFMQKQQQIYEARMKIEKIDSFFVRLFSGSKAELYQMLKVFEWGAV